MDLMEDVSPNENGGDFNCHVSSPEGKPLKTKIDTQNDAMFEEGDDIFQNPSFLVSIC